MGKITFELIIKYVFERRGNLLYFPWPSEWSMTFVTVDDLSYISQTDVLRWRDLYLCCETELQVIGVLHRSVDSWRGPIVLVGKSGGVYIYNGDSDDAIYFVCNSFDEIFKVGLKYYYPIYSLEECYLSDSTLRKDLTRNNLGYGAILIYRDTHLGEHIVLKTTPFEAILYFCNKKSQNISETTFSKYKELLEEDVLDVIFSAQINVNGKWETVNIIIAISGRLFAADKNHDLVYLASNIQVFFRIGFLRYENNRRFCNGFFLYPEQYHDVETRFSRRECPLGKNCGKKASVSNFLSSLNAFFRRCTPSITKYNHLR